MKTIKTYMAILLSGLISLCVSAQVEICHIPPGNPSNAHTIFVDSNAIAAHLDHGDYMGACDISGISVNVEICHIPPDNPSDAHAIFVDSNAIAAHLAHGDYMGSCDTSVIIINEPQFEISVAPNPYSGFTTIQYTLPEDGYMLIEVYDQYAHKIATVVSAPQVAGVYSYQFSAVALGYSPGYFLLNYTFWGAQTHSGTIVLLEL